MHLNCHTFYSFKFGTMSPENLLREAMAKGVHKLVLTDINNTSAILDFHRLAKKAGIQPVAGIDFRKGVQQKFIGIAKNQQGFLELNTFLSRCLLEGGPGLTGREALVPDHAPEFRDAFVIYPFASAEASGNGESSVSAARLQAHEFIGIKPADLNRLRFSPCRHHPEKLVLLAPVTFRNKVDFNTHRLLRAMDNNTVLSKLPVSEQAPEHEVMLREEELCFIYKDFPSIIYNTRKILDECELIDFEFGKNKNKKYFTGNEADDRALLDKLCEEGMQYRYPVSNEDIRARFKKEIDLIISQQFTAYFLINHDLVRFARHKNFFYVGRGSGANSMVAYLLNITDVDPIELDLYFERFINASRKNPPDFDIDFSSDERDEVINYIFSKHGNKHTSLLGTYTTLQADSVVRELGKVFGLPKAEIDVLQNPRLYPPSRDHIVDLIYRYARQLHDFPSHLGIHAGGILISEHPIASYTALSNPPKGFPLTQFSMLEAEDVGLYKFDILSQRGLGKMRDAVNIIAQNQQVAIDIHDVKRFMNDEAVRDNLKNARLMGCFYVESPAMRMLLTKLRASTYLDLVAASSIIRPGVAQSGMMQEYIRRFHEPDHGKKRAIPALWELMEDTFGVMVYQEDVIKVAHHFGKLTLAEADKLRRGMGGKYRGRQEFQEVKDQFIANCRREGYDEKLIGDVWFQMETFGGYAFAKGHSASYAVESYQCMFLKTHYPLEFMVAVINNGGGFFRTEYYIHEARMCGATVHAPDINKSEVVTTIYGTHIYLGFALVADLERKLQEDIILERSRNGAFSSLENFMRRVTVSVDQLRILIRIRAFRFTGRTKQELLWDIHSILGHQKKSVARRELFEGENKKYDLPELFRDTFDEPRDEQEILGFPLCAPFDLVHPPKNPGNDLLAADLKNHTNKIIEITGYYVTYKPTRTKKGEAMMFGCFIDREGFFFDTNHFPEASRNFPFRGKGCYRIKGKVAEEFGFYSINVLEMHKLDYVMYDADADTIARSRPDPVIAPMVVPASKEYQYLLAINPPPHIRHEAELLKKNFHRHFDHYQAVTSRPHIELCSFLMSGTKEAEVVKQVSAVTGRHAPFALSLKNFDSISSHTIYIEVLNADDLVNVIADLKKEFGLSPKTSRFMHKPHLAIAKGLDKEKFSRASAVFCEQEYAASFVAATMVLLKKEATQKFAKYEVVREFDFEGTQKNNSQTKPHAIINQRITERNPNSEYYHPFPASTLHTRTLEAPNHNQLSSPNSTLPEAESGYQILKR